MHLIARCQDESIRIGEHIEITIIALHERWVEVGIVAPEGVSVERAERLIKSAAQWRRDGGANARNEGARMKLTYDDEDDDKDAMRSRIETVQDALAAAPSEGSAMDREGEP